MNFTELVSHHLDFNLEYAKQLVADVPEEQMAVKPGDGLENHPAFTLGHLVSGSADLASDLGAPFEMPDGWADLFVRKGPGDPRLPESNASAYPTKRELLEELEKQHEKLKRLIAGKTEADYNKTMKWRFSHYFPTIRDLVLFMCICHESMHLGQLASWRRAMNMDSALAKF